MFKGCRSAFEITYPRRELVDTIRPIPQIGGLHVRDAICANLVR